MLLDRTTPKIFRAYHVEPTKAYSAARTLTAQTLERAARHASLQAWAVHLADDQTRVIATEAWRDMEHGRRDGELDANSVLYQWAGTGGIEPTPVGDASQGVIVIDIFAVWSAVVGPVSAFNLRNGEAFNRHPGCISTSVFRGRSQGRIATYARWRSTADFLEAFEAAAGGTVRSVDDINASAAKKTLGLIRPDYHTYELHAAGGLD